MEKSIGFKITIEFELEEFMDEKTFHDEFDCDPMAVYRSYGEEILEHTTGHNLISITTLPLNFKLI